MAEKLASWDTLSDRVWPTLLLGNGVSINIWRGFGYTGLLEQARLNAAARRLFTDFETVNFETVLEALWHAERTLEALRRSTASVRNLYEHVQSQLVEAVHSVHIAWAALPPHALDQILGVLMTHRHAFTLNYDLLTYWAAMRGGPAGHIKDFFWGPGSTFDRHNRALLDSGTGFYYLHGGLHLWYDAATGSTGKWTRGSGSRLLADLSRTYVAKTDRHPLFVSEGTSRQKMGVIRRSDYLAFALESLNENESDTVIFGASFGPQDKHITKALNAGEPRNISISVRPGSPDQDEMMARCRSALPNHRLTFFDSTTHPLGDPALSATAPP
ncbi:hypothetical protein FHT44_006307 [Mycolicibacterium sp. BK634]|uniref:DUF4917 family protein n=1 Tax=Mycolicibacterium sp. BK634 TaxID=2587099 RepID=UPI0016207F84|nr:DUF4917 family protein [Mycolicibacterium sp. BK634]MBB3753785.1 hypothetical protein [Mycolicibacterium sp. BK634]